MSNTANTAVCDSHGHCRKTDGVCVCQSRWTSVIYNFSDYTTGYIDSNSDYACTVCSVGWYGTDCSTALLQRVVNGSDGYALISSSVIITLDGASMELSKTGAYRWAAGTRSFSPSLTVFSLFLFLSLSVALSLSLYLSLVSLSVCRCLSVCPSLFPCLSLSLRRPVSPCLSVSVSLSVCLSLSFSPASCISLSLYLSLSACLSVRLSIPPNPPPLSLSLSVCLYV